MKINLLPEKVELIYFSSLWLQHHVNSKSKNISKNKWYTNSNEKLRRKKKAIDITETQEVQNNSEVFRETEIGDGDEISMLEIIGEDKIEVGIFNDSDG